MHSKTNLVSKFRLFISIDHHFLGAPLNGIVEGSVALEYVKSRLAKKPQFTCNCCTFNKHFISFYFQCPYCHDTVESAVRYEGILEDLDGQCS